MKYIGVILFILIPTITLAQTVSPDKDTIIAVLQQQRNNALDAMAMAAAQIQSLQKELAATKTPKTESDQNK